MTDQELLEFEWLWENKFRIEPHLHYDMTGNMRHYSSQTGKDMIKWVKHWKDIANPNFTPVRDVEFEELCRKYK